MNIKKSKFIILILLIVIVSLVILYWNSSSNFDWDDSSFGNAYILQDPDLSTSGISLCMKGDINPYTSAADDFIWNKDENITMIDIWGSFKNDILPKTGVNSLKFKIKIYKNHNNSPGSNIWEETFNFEDYTVKYIKVNLNSWFCTWSDYFNKNNHEKTYQYDFLIKDDNPLILNLSEIYWLELRWVHDKVDYAFGWKSTAIQNGWGENAYSFDGSNWKSLIYPSDHEFKNQKIDLAFAIQ